MPYEYTFLEDTDATSGKTGRALPTPILFSEVFDGAPQFYSGSTFTVQEVLEIESEIIIGQERLVDVDFRWFQPKVYLGTYQFEAALTSIQNEQELGQGFLTNAKHTFIRRSQYTITANPDTPIAYEDVVTIDNCNFETITAGIEFGGAELEIQKPLRNKNMFNGKISRSRAPLVDGVYNQFFNIIGLYYNPGCRLVALKHRVQIINALQTDFNPYPEFTCEILGG